MTKSATFAHNFFFYFAKAAETQMILVQFLAKHHNLSGHVDAIPTCHTLQNSLCSLLGSLSFFLFYLLFPPLFFSSFSHSELFVSFNLLFF